MKITMRLPIRFAVLAFILSLFFHTIMVLYSLIGKQNNFVNILEEKEQITKIKEDKEWVQTKAHSNSFGAPIFFQDEPEEIIKEEMPDETRTAEKTELSENNTFEENKSHQTSQPTEEIIPKQEKETTVIKNNVSPLPAYSQSKKREKSPVMQKREIQRKIATKSETKAPLSLAQLTNGFLNHIKNEGTHSIEMIGGKKGRPSDEQIKYERYLEKIVWCLQNSCSIHRDKGPRFLLNTTAHIYVSLQRDGIPQDIRVFKSSGSIEVDSYILFIFKDASSSFPPIPSYIADNPLNFGIRWIL